MVHKSPPPRPIPKALSSEDLLLSDFPKDRPYIVFPQERYDLNLQYFTPTNLIPPKVKRDAEKELRMCYRAGHLDEIKKKQFGQVYTSTRKYYMDQELKFLKDKKLYDAKKYK